MAVNNAIINRKARFASEGIRFQRHNPDGTIPTPQRFLGFANTADLSKVLASKKGNITIKIDYDTPVTKEVDFTAASDLTRVTVAQAVTALTSAAFTGITFSVDGATGRLKGSQTGTGGGKIIQVLGPLAAALDFGQGIKHGGNGLEVISFFDDETISIGLPKDIKDKEEIEQEGLKGTLNKMIIGAMIQGISPVVTLKEKNYYLLEMIQGGDLDREKGTYDPPLSNESDSPTFYAEIISAIYGSGSSKISDMHGFERLLLRTMIGKEGDVPIEAKAWATYAFNLSATEYTDEHGVKFAAWQEQTLSLTEFDALRVKDISIKA